MSRFRPLLLALAINIACWVVFILFLILFYFAWLREYQMNWGATDEEVNRYMAGDELVLGADLDATRAVEIEASPEQIWPWIVQMGYKRAGFYGFDKLDNGGIPSAENLIPEYQDLQIGDSIPLGGPYLQVVEMEPHKSMLWVFMKGAGPWEGATWSWRLYKIDEKRTRLVSRLRQKYTLGSIQELIAWSLIDAVEILMMRTTLLGIKHRVENT